MKIKRLHFKQFKRFTDLEITDIPESAKLVLVVGPNGSGKSSLFDALIHWHRQGAGWGMDTEKLYFQKGDTEGFQWNQAVVVETFGNQQPIKNSLYVRTAYRHDPDFSIGQLQRLNAPDTELRVARANQHDQTVSQNYQRLVYDTVAGVYDTRNNEKSVEKLRSELIGGIRKSMRAVFGDLVLNDISDPLGGGSFFFEKGNIKSYHYKNLSGGEKAAFDILLDIHIKKRFYADAIWCIDEIETHLHTSVQGALIREIFSLVPDTAQLWLTTHSLGIMRAAYALSIENSGSVSIIDFDGIDSDVAGRIRPSSLGRISWEKLLSIALGDLSSRIMPSVIIVCEGSSIGSRRKNFDAEIYNRILGNVSADVVFVSGGSSNQLTHSSAMIRAALDEIGNGSRIVPLCDRDDKSDREVADFERAGGIVLQERNLESYLFADDVLTKLASLNGGADRVANILMIKSNALEASVKRGNRPDDLKSAAGEIFNELVKELKLNGAGNDKEAFMRDTLAPLITQELPTFQSLKNSILEFISK